MNKQFIIEQIIARLDAELARYAKAARAAQADATDEQSKAENKYDTRGLEASYLAHGQSRQAKETEQAREQYAATAWRAFAPDEPIETGALIALESAGERCWYFLGPAAGGTEVACENEEVLVVTPQSPLGRLLVGKRRDDRVEMGCGQGTHDLSRDLGGLKVRARPRFILPHSSCPAWQETVSGRATHLPRGKPRTGRSWA